jgi:hypothetical protein
MPRTSQECWALHKTAWAVQSKEVSLMLHVTRMVAPGVEALGRAREEGWRGGKGRAQCSRHGER